jgi:hypothetical protein
MSAPTIRNEPATPALNALMDDLKVALAAHTDLSGMQMLAVVSQFLGGIIAFQDARRFTTEMVMEIVTRNIELGNQAGLNSALGQPQGRA